MMKHKLNLRLFYLGLGVATIVACGGGNPYDPLGLNTGTGSYTMSISPASTTVFGNAVPPAKMAKALSVAHKGSQVSTRVVTPAMGTRGTTFGSSSSYTITLTPSGGFDKTVTLSVTNNVGNWLDASLDKTSVNLASGTQTATLTVSLNNNWDQETGQFNLPVTATGGGITRTQNAVVNVSAADYTITVTPTPQNMNNGTLLDKFQTRGLITVQDVFTVTVTPNNGFFGTVPLSVSNPNPSVFNAALDSNSVTTQNGNPATTTLRVTRIGTTTQTGDNVFTVNGSLYSINRSGTCDVVLVNGTP